MKIYNINFNIFKHHKILIKSLKCISLHKIINFLGINISAKLQLTQTIFKPYSAIIEPSKKCNLSCKYCLINQNEYSFSNTFMSFKTYKRFIDQNNHLIFLFFAGYGEPSLNPFLDKMMKYAKHKRILTILETNATNNIINIHPDFIIFSLDTNSQKEYITNKGKDLYQTAISNIKSYNIANKHYTITFLQFLINKKNEDHLNTLIEYNKELKCDFTILKKTLIYNEIEDKFKITSGKFKNIAKENQNFKCKQIYYTTKLSATGSILPCCNCSTNEQSLGNIESIPFNTIWKNKKYQQIRILSKKNLPIIKECYKCHKLKKTSSFIKIIQNKY